MANADGLFTPPPFELPDDRNADAFVPVGNLIEELERRYPSKTDGQCGDMLTLALARGDLTLKDDDGKLVDPDAIGYRRRYGLNPDNVTLIVNPELQKVPVRLVSWREFNKLFPGETEPAIQPSIALAWARLHEDARRYLLNNVELYGEDLTAWTTDDEDTAFRQSTPGITDKRIKQLRQFLRPLELKPGPRRHEKRRSVPKGP